jgi:hypothetical protein
MTNVQIPMTNEQREARTMIRSSELGIRRDFFVIEVSARFFDRKDGARNFREKRGFWAILFPLSFPSCLARPQGGVSAGRDSATESVFCGDHGVVTKRGKLKMANECQGMIGQ